MLIAGGHPDRFFENGKTIIKRIEADSLEHVSYDILKHTPINRFIPKHYKTIDVDGTYFIELENLIAENEKWNIIDIKLSYIKKPPLCYSYNLKFRVVGTIIDGKHHRADKTLGQAYSLELLERHVQNHVHHLPSIINQLDEIRRIVNNGYKFYGSSLFIALSANKCVIKIIDFSDFQSERFENREDVDINFYDIETSLANLRNLYFALLFKYHHLGLQKSTKKIKFTARRYRICNTPHR